MSLWKILYHEKYLIINADNTNISPEQNALLRENGKHAFIYLSICMADSQSTYWEQEWTTGSPNFVRERDSEADKTNYFRVNFWDPKWESTLINFTQYRITSFGFSGVLLDDLGEYKNVLEKNLNAAARMVLLAKNVAKFIKQQDPWMKLWMQDAIELYNIDNFKDALDGISIEASSRRSY